MLDIMLDSLAVQQLSINQKSKVFSLLFMEIHQQINQTHTQTDTAAAAQTLTK